MSGPKKHLSLLLAALIIFTLFSAFPAGVSEAESYAGLNDIQVYFTRLIGSYARADYFKTDVLASVTLSQAVYESGWARYSLPVGGKNLFGIKAYNTWSGKVFDPNEATVYASYNDLLLAKGQSYVNTVSAWRAHGSWAESVESHSSLFTSSSNYKAVVGEKDYAVAARAIVAGGYCSDNGYAETVIKLIQQYNYTEYDDLSPDEDGVVAMISSEPQHNMAVGDTYQVALEIFPAEAEPSSVVWSSANEAVATVDETGLVTALSHGMSLISATLPNGREACCIVYVDCNATVIDSDVNVRTSPDISAGNNGKFYRGTPIKVASPEVFTDPSGNAFYQASGYNSKGVLVSGYVLEECVYLDKHEVTAISVVKDDITLAVGDVYTVAAAVAPADAEDTSLVWTSTAPEVASVDENGNISALSKGEAEVKATAASGVEKTVKVTVADAQKDYYAVVSSYETLTVRAEPNGTSSSRGRIPFLTQVRVIGEPVGLYCKVTGLNTSGNSITGYVHSAYLRFYEPKTKVTKTKVPGDIRVYSEKSDTSYSFGLLISGSDCTVIGEPDADGWSFVIGTKNPSNVKAIFGYAKMEVSPDDPGQDVDPDGGSCYAVTNSTLRVRSGAGTDHDTVGILDENTRVIITGGVQNGWYRVTAKDKDGNTVSGYSSAEYITLLYLGRTTARINVRSGPGTNYDSLGVIEKDTELIIYGASEGGWYKAELSDPSSSVPGGYCYANYVTVTGSYTADSPVQGGFGLTDPSLEASGGILYGVRAGTKASTLLSKFASGVTVRSAGGTTLTADELVGTGCVVTEPAGGSLTVIVRGDADGDGEVNAADYIIVKRAFLGTVELNGVYLTAASVSGSAELNIADYIMIKRAVLGTYTL